MEVEYKNTLFDLVVMQVRCITHDSLMAAIFSVFAFFVPAITLNDESVDKYGVVVSYVSSVMAVGAVLLVYFVLVLPLVALFQIKAKGAAGMLGPHKIELNDMGFTEETSVNSSSFKWAGINRVARSGRHIFIYVSRYQVFAIPKKAFADILEADAFYLYARERLNSTSI